MKKHLLFSFLLLFSIAGFSQTCDTVTNVTVSSVGFNTAYITFTASSTAYTYFTQVKDSATGATAFSVTSPSTVVFASGLTSNKKYKVFVTSFCTSGAGSTTANLTRNPVFTTKNNTITYTPMTAAGYQYKYLRVDSGLALPFRDTALGRAGARPGTIAYGLDSNIYLYNGTIWEPINTGAITTDNSIEGLGTGGNPYKVNDRYRLAQRGSNIFYDDFEGNSLLNTRVSPSGHTWAVSGPGAASATVNGRMQASNNIYPFIDYGDTIKYISGVFSFHNSTSQVTLIADKTGALNDMLHLIISPTEWHLQKRVAGGSFDFIASGKHNLITDGTLYGISMQISNDTVVISPPNGIRKTVVDSDIIGINARYGCWQIGPTFFTGQWHSASMSESTLADVVRTLGHGASQNDIEIFRGDGLSKRKNLRKTLTGAAGWYRISTEDIFVTFANVGKMQLSSSGATGGTFWEVDMSAAIGQVPFLNTRFGKNFGTNYTNKLRLSVDNAGTLIALDVYKSTADTIDLSVDFFGAFAPFPNPVVGATVLPSASKTIDFEETSLKEVTQTLTGAVGWYRIANEASFSGLAIEGNFSVKALTETSGQRWNFYAGATHLSFLHNPLLVHEFGAGSVAANISKARLSTDSTNDLVALDVYKNTADTVYLSYTINGTFTPVSSPAIATVLPTQSTILDFSIGGNSGSGGSPGNDSAYVNATASLDTLILTRDNGATTKIVTSIPTDFRPTTSSLNAVQSGGAKTYIDSLFATGGGGAASLDAVLAVGNTTQRNAILNGSGGSANLVIGDLSRTMYQDTVPFIHFQTTNKSVPTNVAPVKIIYSIDASKLGGALTSAHGSWDKIVTYSGEINLPVSDTGDIVFVDGYNYIGGQNYKRAEPSFGVNYETRYHNAGTNPTPATERHEIFLPPNNRFGKGVHTMSGRVTTDYHTWDGEQITKAHQLTKFDIRDTTGQASWIFYPASSTALSRLQMQDSTRLQFDRNNYYPIYQNGRQLIGSIDTGTGINGGSIIVRDGGYIVPSAGASIALGSTTRPLNQGVNLYSSDNNMITLQNGLGADNWTIRKSATTLGFYNSVSTFTPFTIHKSAPNNSLTVSDVGQVHVNGTGLYKFTVTGTSNTVGIAQTGVNTDGDIGYLLNGTTTGSIYGFYSFASATTNIDWMYRNNSAASGASSRFMVSTNGIGAAQAYTRYYTGASDWSIGTARNTTSFDIVKGADLTGTTAALSINYTTEKVSFKNAPIMTLATYADEAAAVAGGLATGTLYKTATGEVRIKL